MMSHTKAARGITGTGELMARRNEEPSGSDNGKLGKMRFGVAKRIKKVEKLGMTVNHPPTVETTQAMKLGRGTDGLVPRPVLAKILGLPLPVSDQKVDKHIAELMMQSKTLGAV